MKNFRKLVRSVRDTSDSSHTLQQTGTFNTKSFSATSEFHNYLDKDSDLPPNKPPPPPPPQSEKPPASSGHWSSATEDTVTADTVSESASVEGIVPLRPPTPPPARSSPYKIQRQSSIGTPTRASQQPKIAIVVSELTDRGTIINYYLAMVICCI